jgi:hypothetical protein
MALFYEAIAPAPKDTLKTGAARGFRLALRTPKNDPELDFGFVSIQGGAVH